MSKLILAETVKEDYVSRTYAQFITSLQRYLSPEEIIERFPDSTYVSPHLTMCCAELLFGTPAFTAASFTPQQFQDVVIGQYGEGLTDQQIGIEFKEPEEGDTLFLKEGDDDDYEGADVSLVRVFTRIETPIAGITFDSALMLQRRIRYILDSKIRAACWPPTFDSVNNPATHRRTDPSGNVIDAAIDPQNGVICHYLRQVGADSIRERTGLYRCLFTTVFA